LLSGSPYILLTGNDREFCNRVEEDLNAMWPVLKTVLGKSLTAVKKSKKKMFTADKSLRLN
jgi:hypothetical protein